jgi:hypothetical protein
MVSPAFFKKPINVILRRTKMEITYRREETDTHRLSSSSPLR